MWNIKNVLGVWATAERLLLGGGQTAHGSEIGQCPCGKSSPWHFSCRLALKVRIRCAISFNWASSSAAPSSGTREDQSFLLAQVGLGTSSCHPPRCLLQLCPSPGAAPHTRADAHQMVHLRFRVTNGNGKESTVTSSGGVFLGSLSIGSHSALFGVPSCNICGSGAEEDVSNGIRFQLSSLPQ